MCGACENCSFDVAIPTKRIFNEIHVTVNSDYQEFVAAVEAFNTLHSEDVKPILLANVFGDSKTFAFDAMTVWKVEGGRDQAYQAMTILVFFLHREGIRIVRRKIETVPWNPEIEHNKSGYYECHLNVMANWKSPSGEFDTLQRVAAHLGGSLSYNVQKPHITVLTLRRHDRDFQAFERQLEWAKDALSTARLPWNKEIVEFAIFDSNPSHDTKWINSWKY